MGGTIYGIAAAALVHPNGGSGGVFRRVQIHVGVITRVDTITVMEIIAAYGASSGSREVAAYGRRAAGELSTRRGSVCDIATATMSTPNGGAIIRRVEIGVGVSSRVDTVAVLNKRSRREVLVISYARGSDVAESVTIVVGAIGSMATGTADTAVEVDVRIGSDCSFLNGTIGEVRNSNVVVWIDAGIDVVGAWTETVVVVTCSMGSDGIEWVEAIVDIVSREGEAKTQHGLVGVVICS